MKFDVWAPTILIPVAAAYVVRGIFATLEHYWPHDYFGFDSGGTIDPVTHRSLIRFVCWRALPVFLAATLVANTLDQLSGRSRMGCGVFVAAYLALSVVPAVLQAHRAPGQRLLRVAILLNVVISVVIAAVSLSAYLVRARTRGMVPAPSVLVEALWTAAFLSAVSMLFLRSIQSRSSLQDLVRASRSELGPELIRYARNRAADYSVDPLIAEAVLIVENLQRPKWIRWMERRKAVLLPEGTYGAMQVGSPSALTDRESIDLAMSRHLRGAQIPSSWSAYNGSAERGLSQAVEGFHRYNPAIKWRDLVLRVLAEISPQTESPTRGAMSGTFGSSETWVGDPESFLRVSDVKYDHAFVGLTVTIPDICESVVEARLVDAEGRAIWVSRSSFGAPAGRRKAALTWLPGNRAATALVVEVLDDSAKACRVDLPKTWTTAIDHWLPDPQPTVRDEHQSS